MNREIRSPGFCEGGRVAAPPSAHFLLYPTAYDLSTPPVVPDDQATLSLLRGLKFLHPVEDRLKEISDRPPVRKFKALEAAKLQDEPVVHNRVLGRLQVEESCNVLALPRLSWPLAGE